MPSKPRRPCGFPGCPGTTKGRYCKAHTKEKERGRPRKARTDAAWQRLRRAVLERDAYLCQECDAPDSDQCDHIIPRSRGGRDVMSNLQTLCLECHGRKTRRGD